MEITQAVELIKAGIPDCQGIWADIGAGTGIFTQALDVLLPAGSTVIALDKSPHPLYYLRLESCSLRVEDGDFNRPLNLPQLDGIVMANALHYAEDPLPVLQNVVQHLRPGGKFILVEYERTAPIATWIPYPIPQAEFTKMATELGLEALEEVGRMPSAFGDEHIYALAMEWGTKKEE